METPEEVFETQGNVEVAQGSGGTDTDVPESRVEPQSVSVSLTPLPETTDGMPEQEASNSATHTSVSDGLAVSEMATSATTVLVRRESADADSKTAMSEMTPVISIHPVGPTDGAAPAHTRDSKETPTPCTSRPMAQSINRWPGFASRWPPANW